MKQIVRYGFVGLISTAINYVLFLSSIAAGMHYLIAATLGSAITVLAGYFLHRIFTFSVPTRPNLREFSSFVGAFAVQYTLAMIGYALLIGFFGINASAAFVINTGGVSLVVFYVLRDGAFRVSV